MQDVPKRSNEFQALVAMVERAFAPRGAKVTESAMVPGLGNEPREIDVLIETLLGPYQMKIAVEAKDEGRKMDIIKFESIVAKYSSRSGIKVNQVVVVSRKGFYKPVIRRANEEGIKLLTLTEALQGEWAQRTVQKLAFSIVPHIAHF